MLPSTKPILRLSRWTKPCSTRLTANGVTSRINIGSEKPTWVRVRWFGAIDCSCSSVPVNRWRRGKAVGSMVVSCAGERACRDAVRTSKLGCVSRNLTKGAFVSGACEMLISTTSPNTRVRNLGKRPCNSRPIFVGWTENPFILSSSRFGQRSRSISHNLEGAKRVIRKRILGYDDTILRGRDTSLEWLLKSGLMFIENPLRFLKSKIYKPAW